MSWLNELRPTIKLTSPEGNVFNAFWKSNDRSVDKKLGVFDAPGIVGSLVQDLQTKSTLYPLTIFFEGAFHQPIANDFFKACKEERGQWKVIHPVKGGLVLQLSKVTENVNPIEDGNITSFSTEWLEPANIERFFSADELKTSLLNRILNTIEDAITQFGQLRADAYAAVNTAVGTFNTVAGLKDRILAELAATQAIINDAFNNAKNAYTNSIAAFANDPTDAEVVAEVVTASIDLTLSAVGASEVFNLRFEEYYELLLQTLALVPESDESNESAFNQVLTVEAESVACLLAMAQIVATSQFQTRTEVVSAMDKITTAFNLAVSELDEIQNQFLTEPIQAQYFSQSNTFGQIQYVFALTIQYLIFQFFNLNAEKRFTLKNARSPLEITITEYGQLGDNDEIYDLFLSSNNLSGNDILLLPAGREVVVYG